MWRLGGFRLGRAALDSASICQPQVWQQSTNLNCHSKNCHFPWTWHGKHCPELMGNTASLFEMTGGASGEPQSLHLSSGQCRLLIEVISFLYLG